jgi:hypothetical protein
MVVDCSTAGASGAPPLTTVSGMVLEAGSVMALR